MLYLCSYTVRIMRFGASCSLLWCDGFLVHWRPWADIFYPDGVVFLWHIHHFHSPYTMVIIVTIINLLPFVHAHVSCAWRICDVHVLPKWIFDLWFNFLFSFLSCFYWRYIRPLICIIVECNSLKFWEFATLHILVHVLCPIMIMNITD